MFFILSKVLSFFAMPFSWVLVLLAISFVWKRKKKPLRIAAVVVLLFFSNSFILKEINRLWEPPIVSDQNLGKFETVVVLGGFAYFDSTENRVIMRESGDRFFQALRLLQNGTAKHLLISGGSGFVTMPDLREAKFVGEYAREIGIPERKIWLETASKNTFENASFSAELLKKKGVEQKPILLVTSAYHMPRAQACFEKQGLTVIPYPADPRVDSRQFWVQDLLLPSSYALVYWNTLIHEWIGYLSYKLMGYI